MTLKIITEPDEPTQFILEDPQFEILKNCIYAPIKSNDEWGRDFWTNKYWGIYDSDGKLVESATFRYMPERTLHGQNETCLIRTNDIPYAPGDSYFYLGNFINHYGHFLCSSMARIWGLPRCDLSKIPVLAHAAGHPSDWFRWSWVPTMLGASGLTIQDFAGFDRPVRLREVIVPGPALVERTLIHRAFATSMNRAGDRLVKTAPSLPWRDIVYLSKEQLAPHTVGAFSNEEELVDHLRARGVSIVYPEKLSLGEQVALFRSTRCIIGQCGSALHTSIFSAPREGQTMISIIDKPTTHHSTHGMFDTANGTRTTFVFIDSQLHDREGARPGLRITDPQRAAEAILDLAHTA